VDGDRLGPLQEAISSPRHPRCRPLGFVGVLKRRIKRVDQNAATSSAAATSSNAITATSRTGRAPAWLNAEGIDVLDIEVTEADIDQGRRCQAAWCMVAVAIRRQFGLPDRRHYTWQRAWDDRRRDARLSVGTVPGDDHWRISYQGVDYLVPEEVGQRIEAWDVGSPIEPFRFRAVRL
jgi:hypothetical protein